MEQLTSTTFDEAVLGAEVPVLVDLWADWCGPCHALEPVLDAIASEQAGRLRIATLDYDAHPEIGRRYDVMSLPTLLLFRDGELVHRMVGARGKHHLLEELDRFL